MNTQSQMNNSAKLLFIFVLISPITMLYSQYLAMEKGKIEYGFTIGLSQSSLQGTPGNVLRFSDSNGISISTHYNYYLSKNWSWNTRLGFDQKGGSDVLAQEPDLTLNYLTISTHPRWHFGKYRKWYFNWGPYLGYLISSNPDDDPFSDEVRNIDWGISASIGYKIVLPKGLTLVLDAGGQTGISSIDNTGTFRRVETETGLFAVGLLF